MSGVSTDFETQNQYFSGQGVVMIGARDANGNAAGLVPLGDCSALQLTINTTVVNHKGSQDGQRAIDKRLQTETNVTATLTIDNWSAANLAIGLRGVENSIAAGSVAAEAVNGYPGMVSPLQHVDISSLVLTMNATPLVAYSAPGTPYDYKFNAEAGSFMLDDGSTGNVPPNLGQTPTGVTVGATTEITVAAPTGYTPAVGDPVVLSGFTGANGAVLNVGRTQISAVSAGNITVAIDTTTDTITFATAKVFFPLAAVALSAAYSYSAQYEIDALTEPLHQVFLRFEGLNTLDTNNPVIVEIPNFSYDPLKEMALLTDTFSQVQLEGTVLYDPLQQTGSKYFRVRKLN